MIALDDRTLVALGLKSFASGWTPVICFTLFAIALMAVSAAWTGHLAHIAADLKQHPRKLIFWTSLATLYPVWALVQQGIVFATLHGLRISLPSEMLPWTPAITAMFFAAAHAPNY